MAMQNNSSRPASVSAVATAPTTAVEGSSLPETAGMAKAENGENNGADTPAETSGQNGSMTNQVPRRRKKQYVKSQMSLGRGRG